MSLVIMHYMLPRIDAHVSIQLNHLLKLPFCIHPDTGTVSALRRLLNGLVLGKLCVPVGADNIEVFDPNAVPTLLELAMRQKESGTVSLPGLDIFEDFCSRDAKTH